MVPLRLLAPPAHLWQVHAWDLTSGADLQQVRLGLQRCVATDQPGDSAELDDLAQRMSLVATELAGNALRHGRPPVTVRLLRDTDCYILEVSDHDPDHVPALAGPRRDHRAGGRGLLIAGSLADQLCWFRDENTKYVWASFPATFPPPDRPGHAPGR